MSNIATANIVISIYNMLWVVGMLVCMTAGIRPPPTAYIVTPWVAIGVVVYVAVLRGALT